MRKVPSSLGQLLRVLSARLLWFPLSVWHALRWFPRYNTWLMRNDNMEKIFAAIFGGGIFILLLGLVLEALRPFPFSGIFSIIFASSGIFLMFASFLHVIAVVALDVLYSYYNTTYRERVAARMPETSSFTSLNHSEEWFSLPLPVVWKARIAQAKIPVKDAMKTSTLRYSKENLAVYGALQTSMFTVNS